MKKHEIFYFFISEPKINIKIFQETKSEKKLANQRTKKKLHIFKYKQKQSNGSSKNKKKFHLILKDTDTSTLFF